ncbi:ABC transporter permease protein [uncultured Paludibacter sp.]|nr:ABC transporter permease protein [uncultured Paludibacter sp.]
MIKLFPKTKDILTHTFENVGDLTFFTGKVMKQFFTPPYEHKELLKQAYLLGNKSLGLISITGFIMGLVLTMQSRPVMVRFGAEAMIPGMVAVSVLREIGPAITALLCAGKMSSGIGAEIGAMKVTEQIDAMEVSGTKPLGFVVASRVLATTITVPLLIFFADACGLFGSYLAMNFSSPFSFQLYMRTAFDMLDFIDIIPATIKSVFFGFFIGLIGAYKGYQAGQGTESVGIAANSAVVSASMAIFIIDLLAVMVANLFMP